MVVKLLERREENLETIEESSLKRKNLKVVHGGPTVVEGGYHDYVAVTDIYVCTGVLVYDSVGEKVLAYHVRNKGEIDNGELQDGLEKFESEMETSIPVAHVIKGSSDNNEIVESTEDVLKNYRGIRPGIIKYSAEEGTEGDICIDIEDGKLYDFRPSEETVENNENPV